MQRRFYGVQLGSIELFCLVVQEGSFSAAAVVSGITPAAVSRAIGRLEERLNIKLFIRTTRQMRLTEAGLAYYEQCRQAIDRILAIEQALEQENTTPSGTLYVSVPTPYAHYRLLPALASFLAQYPNIDVNIHASNRNIDFVNDTFDVAIRGGHVTDSNLIARPLEDAELVVVGTPDYFSRRGEPQQLADLTQHDCIQYILPGRGREAPWRFKVDGDIIDYKTQGRITIQEEYLSAKHLLIQGAGLMQIYRFVVEEELASGQLVSVLTDYQATRRFTLLYPHADKTPLRVRKFIDFVTQLSSVNSLVK